MAVNARTGADPTNATNGASATIGALIRQDPSVIVLMLAIALLPVDGTVLGGYMPFWTPISPWLFMLYTALNWRIAWRVACDWRFCAFFMLPVLLVALSVVGWMTVAFHPLPAINAFAGVVSFLACLSSLEIAVGVKRLDWRGMVGLLLAVYWIAFGVGIIQFLAIHLDVEFVQDWFSHLMSRQYITATSQWGGGRPQFLFAEPSYIGMHLFGVLLPLRWMLRQRAPELSHDLGVLIVMFAAGAVAMGSGVRIIIDSAVALIVSIVVGTDFRRKKQRRRAIMVFAALLAGGMAVALSNNRIRTILTQGPVNGDASSSARLSQALTPLVALWQHPLNLFLGFGAGNVAEANRLGTDTAYKLLNGPDAKAPWWVWANWNPDGAFTMSAYVSFVTEFGLVGLCALIAIVIRRTIRGMGARPQGQQSIAGSGPAPMGTKTIICWLVLVAYLYVQFEGYAFYALPLFVWAARSEAETTPGVLRTVARS